MNLMTTRTGMVMETIRQKIRARDLKPGGRLPSIRALAASLGVSASTVVDAYDRLAAEGIIRARPGSGFYVAGPLAPLALAELSPRLERDMDPFWVSRQSLEAADDLAKPGCGWLPPDWLPQASLRSALRSLARSPDRVLGEYGTPLGLPPLRQLLARRLQERGIDAHPERMLLTESGTQAIDLICRFLLEPGDAVLVDDPCYFNFHALLRAHRVRILSVPYRQGGPDLDVFARVLAEERPRLYITNAAIHNPTGAVLSPVTAHRLLKLADAAGLTIVEDDIFADFETIAAPRLAAFDGLNQVIHIGSFSKTLSAAARCGFIAGRGDWIEALTDLKIATSFAGGALSAELVLHGLADGGYRKHMEGLRLRLGRAMGDTARKLRGLGIRPVLEPQAGMFLWCDLPDGIGAAELAREALAGGVLLAPGGRMRFNVSQMADARVLPVLSAALEKLRRSA